MFLLIYALAPASCNHSRQAVHQKKVIATLDSIYQNYEPGDTEVKKELIEGIVPMSFYQSIGHLYAYDMATINGYKVYDLRMLNSNRDTAFDLTFFFKDSILQRYYVLPIEILKPDAIKTQTVSYIGMGGIMSTTDSQIVTEYYRFSPYLTDTMTGPFRFSFARITSADTVIVK